MYFLLRASTRRRGTSRPAASGSHPEEGNGIKTKGKNSYLSSAFCALRTFLVLGEGMSYLNGFVFIVCRSGSLAKKKKKEIQSSYVYSQSTGYGSTAGVHPRPGLVSLPSGRLQRSPPLPCQQRGPEESTRVGVRFLETGAGKLPSSSSYRGRSFDPTFVSLSALGRIRLCVHDAHILSGSMGTNTLLLSVTPPAPHPA